MKKFNDEDSLNTSKNDILNNYKEQDLVEFYELLCSLKMTK